jgi:chitinase
MKGKFPDKLAAPYVDTSMGVALESCPAKYVCLAFVLAGGDGSPAWNGTDGLQKKYCTDLIARLRRGGGDAIVSFGGQAGNELAHAITDPARLAAAYGSVVDALQLGWADFDIEGASIEDRPVVERRMAAIRILQARHPALVVSFTLPVMPTGLTASGVGLCKAAVAAGVRVDVVNVMCMDYGESFRGDQGAHAISAAKATRAQLLSAGLPGTKLGITPMIGVNDTAALVFTLEHARAVAAFARATPWVRWLSFWSLGRDNGTSVGKAASNSSSGVVQKPWDFTRALAM